MLQVLDMFFYKATRLIILYIIMVSLSGCFLKPRLSEWAENYLYIDDDFVYDADTILQTIANGEIGQDTFRLYSAALDDDSPLRYQFWEQDDHLALAAGFHQWYRNGSTEKWLLLEVSFRSSCEKMKELSGDPPSPFNWGKVTVTYYKPGTNLEYDVPNRQVHKIILSPNFGTLLLSEWIHNPKPFVPEVEIPELGSLDSAGMKIKVADAYRIAEEAGGHKYDQCSIRASNSLEDEYDGWYIKFLVDSDESFKIIINDQTGEYEVIND